MNILPCEVLEIVSQHMETEDYRACLTVNKFWHAFFLKQLYTTIVFYKEQSLKLFMESILTYPQCTEAAKYVKKITTLAPTTLVKIDVNGRRIDYIDMLMFCPNIEVMSVKADGDLVYALSITDKPVLKKVKELHFGYYGFDDVKMMQCYYKYRLTLTYLMLKSISSVEYLDAFPCLQNLYIINCNHMLNSILGQCPTLVHLYYTCTSLNMSEIADTEIEVFPRLQELTLNVDNMDPYCGHYIKNSLVGLKILKLTICNRREDAWDIICGILEMNTLDRLEITLHSYQLNTISHFIQYASLLSEQRKQPYRNSSTFSIHNSNVATVLSVTHCPRTGIKTISSVVYRPVLLSLSYKFLNEIGHNLNVLMLGGNGSSYNLNIINNQCPSLSELTLVRIHLVQFHDTIPNNHLKTLILDRCTLSQMIINQVALAYPTLKNLELLLSNLASDHHLHLPDTIKFLKIVEFSFYTSRWIIIKESNGVPLCWWKYCPQSKKMVCQEALNSIPLLVDDSAVLLSSTLTNVSLKRYL
ncbi:hypothetical protein BDB01DRAFT_839113 [Pilobolus umbonatus]|nr:hypothetical protein BDB01DRAFT_839113 [Pilobolus umbonatus]